MASVQADRFDGAKLYLTNEKEIYYLANLLHNSTPKTIGEESFRTDILSNLQRILPCYGKDHK